jgi:Fe-S cluster assembly protein SufD
MDRDRVEPYINRLASSEQNSFTALNTAFLEDGGFVFVPDDTVLDEVVHLIFISAANGEAVVSHPRNLIVLGRRSQLRVVETYVGLANDLYFTNGVTEIVAGEDSVIDHYKLQRESDRAFHVATTHVSQARYSNFSTHVISLGGRLVRNDISTLMGGEASSCTLNGLYVTREEQHVDNRTNIDHEKPRCNSRQFYKGVLGGKSHGVFNGKILVRADAQQTNATQSNKNLLLTEGAQIDTKPQLEIYADDVKCTHGATIGKIDDEALFYTRSRGIDEESARTLLTYAFASDILRSINIKPIQCQIDLVLLNRLSRGI